MKKNFSRTTITVPHDLKLRMKRSGSGVNWSAIACDAFETKLEEIGPFQEITTIEATVERLKKLAIETTEESTGASEPSPAGEAAGRHWAMNLASTQQLSALEDFQAEVTPEKWSEVLSTRDGWFELTRRIATDEAIELGGLREFEHGSGDEAAPGRPRREERGGPDRHGRGRHDGHRRRFKRGRGHGKGQRPGGFRARAFWRSILEERPCEPNFFASFADGALAVWQEVKPQLG
ncbi:hypothetical protein NHH03_03995 [Stieleria sp. TO1_6]|uniref:hypothetical protein n=1 Tax=Stieleria tagensis TaxID=2956795 RepID=UPI00209AC591|nr:hypothetical protein [Stieleria tagensis]MCO8120887.1 hypothetical protein [Stieleria tagensis]